MHLDWTPAQQETIAAAQRFAESALAARPAPAGFDRAAWELCAGAGIQGLLAPSAWGGRELDALTTVGAFEALGRAGADRGLLFALGAHVFGFMATLARAGSAAQHERWGRPLVDGRAVAALAITEENGGSSLASMATTAVRSPAGYTVRGSKIYVTNGPVADVLLLIAAEFPARGILGLTGFLVPRDTAGLRLEPLEPTLGLKGAPMARVILEDCVLPAEAVVGRAGGGFALLQTCMQWERTCLLAGFLGAAGRDLDAAIGFARGRGGPQGTLFEHQAVSHRLARVRSRLEAARWQLYRGAWAIDRREDPLLWPAMVRLTVGETLVDAAMETMRIFAGAGWVDEKGVATALRDVIATLSASGTADAQLNVIAACLKRVSR